MEWTETVDNCLHLRECQLYASNSSKTRRIFLDLQSEIEFLTAKESKVRVFGKWHNIPRKVAGYGDANVVYSYSNSQMKAQKWTTTLKMIREDIEKLLNNEVSFNFVLINYYENGLQHMGFHRDDEKELDPCAPIASLSLGASRDFLFKPRSDVETERKRICLNLSDGSLLLMLGKTNLHWMHALPQRKRCKEARINLTFRKIQVN